jgi:ribose-phosphate pyrophosphokinase
VLAAAAHGVFAPAADAVLGASELERIVVTDTIPPLRVSDPQLISRLDQISTAALFAEAIQRLHCGGSLVELQGG